MRSIQPWRLAFRSTSLPLLFFGSLLGPSACESGPSPSTPTDDLTSNSPPNIISFGTNVPELTDGETVRFVALVTDPGGVDSLIGGQLTSPDGAIKYGAFSASQQGAYSLDLSWSQLSQAKPLAFATEETRTFVGEFYDSAGQRMQRSVELRFHCRGEPACEGRCVATGNLCPTSTSKLCVRGECMAGCYVNKEFTLAEAMSSSDACKVCKPETSRTALQTLPDYASCKPGFACGDGKCEVPFTRQDPKTTGTLYSVSAPTAMFQIAVGSSGTAVRTADGGATWTAVSPGAETLRGVFAVSASEIYSVGSFGTIYKSSDGGASWTKQSSTVTSTLYGVWASGPNDVWVVGASGTVLRSTSGGATWTKLTTPTTVTLNAVWGSGADDVYMVGDSGTIWRTTNSGAAFTPLPAGVSSSLSGVWGSAANNVYVTGSSSTVLRTTTSGATWTKLGTPDSFSSLYGVWGSSAANVYFIGSSGLIWRTVDGAAITAVPSASFSTFNGISGTSDRAFTIVGSSSVLRKL